MGWGQIRNTSHEPEGNTTFGSLLSLVKIECDSRYISIKQVESNTVLVLNSQTLVKVVKRNQPKWNMGQTASTELQS